MDNLKSARKVLGAYQKRSIDREIDREVRDIVYGSGPVPPTNPINEFGLEITRSRTVQPGEVNEYSVGSDDILMTDIGVVVHNHSGMRIKIKIIT